METLVLASILNLGAIPNDRYEDLCPADSPVVREVDGFGKKIFCLNDSAYVGRVDASFSAWDNNGYWVNTSGNRAYGEWQNGHFHKGLYVTHDGQEVYTTFDEFGRPQSKKPVSIHYQNALGISRLFHGETHTFEGDPWTPRIELKDTSSSIRSR